MTYPPLRESIQILVSNDGLVDEAGMLPPQAEFRLLEAIHFVLNKLPMYTFVKVFEGPNGIVNRP